MKKKIVVFGGGLSAMTSVYLITKEPNWQEKYEITVYQLGWRLGGKGASGVNADKGYRIEEHGLHFWFGFYENAFHMMKECYKELGRNPSAPMATFDAAFKGLDHMTVMEHVGDEWIPWNIQFPPMPGVVGDGISTTPKQMIDAFLKFMIQELKEWLKQHHIIKPKKRTFWQKILAFLHLLPSESFIDKLITRAAKKTLTEVITVFKDTPKDAKEGDQLIHGAERIFGENAFTNEEAAWFTFEHLKEWLWDEIGELVEHNTPARRIWTLIDFAGTLFPGMVADKVLYKKDGEWDFDFDKINNYDYIEWLAKHGASPITQNSPFVRAMYDGPFSFIKGNVNEPNVEAGTILRIFLRLGFASKEHVIWKMQAGMGDTIFGPMYEVLKRRGVKFEFFHKLNNIGYDKENQTVDTIQIGRQVTLTKEYNPFLDVKGLPCWPNEPLYDFIEPKEVEELKKGKINLECSWSAWKDREVIHLKKGVDFDEIILGASLAGLPYTCSELINNSEKWYNMAAKIQTVETQAMQVWFDASPKELGITDEWFVTTYVEPLDTISCMNQVLDKEDWPANKAPKYVAYFCGAKPSAANIMPYNITVFPEKELDKVKHYMKDYFTNNLKPIIPNMLNADGTVKWNWLTDLENRTGEQRFDFQYFRSNIDPAEQYVLSVKNSTQYRVKTNETDVDNLYICGDWIFSGYNVGSVEACAVAGTLTASAVLNKQLPIYNKPENL